MSEDRQDELLQDQTSGASTLLTETVKIKPWSVSKSEEHIILWSDAMMAFGNPVHVWSEDVVLPFLANEKSEALQPHRISAHPGVVLDVTIETPGIEEGHGIPPDTEFSSFIFDIVRSLK
ncbi:hypothetical protein BGX26_001767 [Mortierella sp. AD094]|nr:hypothetical protein BGX26_001767 [Mortierella sp. AD094]